MKIIPVRLMAVMFVIGVLAYVAISRLVFEVPASLLEGEACGFTSADFAPSGALQFSEGQAWWVSFTRKEEFYSAFSLGLVAAFLSFALGSARRLGGAVASGAAVGSGLLAFGTVCLSCLAPVLSLVGMGVAGGFLAGVPKWLMAFNTLMIVSWGVMYLARRLSVCDLLQSKSMSCNPNLKTNP